MTAGSILGISLLMLIMGVTGMILMLFIRELRNKQYVFILALLGFASSLLGVWVVDDMAEAFPWLDRYVMTAIVFTVVMMVVAVFGKTDANGMSLPRERR